MRVRVRPVRRHLQPLPELVAHVGREVGRLGRGRGRREQHPVAGPVLEVRRQWRQWRWRRLLRRPVQVVMVVVQVLLLLRWLVVLLLELAVLRRRGRRQLQRRRRHGGRGRHVRRAQEQTRVRGELWRRLDGHAAEILLVPAHPASDLFGLRVLLAADRRVLQRVHDEVHVGPELLLVLFQLQVEPLGPGRRRRRRRLPGVHGRRPRGRPDGGRVDVVVERGAALVHVQVVVAVDHALVRVLQPLRRRADPVAQLDHVGQQVERAADVPADGGDGGGRAGAGAAVEVGQRQVGQRRSAGDKVHRRRQRHVIRVRVQRRAGGRPGRVETLARRLQRLAAHDQVGQLGGGQPRAAAALGRIAAVAAEAARVADHGAAAATAAASAAAVARVPVQRAPVPATGLAALGRRRRRRRFRDRIRGRAHGRGAGASTSTAAAAYASAERTVAGGRGRQVVQLVGAVVAEAATDPVTVVHAAAAAAAGDLSVRRVGRVVVRARGRRSHRGRRQGRAVRRVGVRRRGGRLVRVQRQSGRLAAAAVAVHAAAVLGGVRRGRRALGRGAVAGARVHAAAGVGRLIAVVRVRRPGPRVPVHQVRVAAVLRRLHRVVQLGHGRVLRRVAVA